MSSLKKPWHDVVWGSSINQACSIFVNKPAGNTFPILHMAAEILLLVSGDKILEKLKGVYMQKEIILSVCV